MTDSARTDLIGEIYEVVLDPDRFGRFMDLWDEFLSGELDQLISDNNNADPPQLLSDPKIESHFQRAYEIMERIGRETRSNSSLNADISRAPIARTAVLRNGSVAAQSDAAKETLGTLKNISELRDFIDSEDFQRLRDLLSGLDSVNATGKSCILRLSNRLSSPKGESTTTLAIAKVLFFEREDVNAVIITPLKVEWSAAIVAMLEETFGITDSEADMLHALCNGEQLTDVAERRQRSIHTVRTQVKSLLRKSGTRSQSDLVRLTASLSAHVVDTGQRSISQRYAGFVDSGIKSMVPLQDGRVLPVHRIGSPNYAPIVFVHGMLDGIAVTSLLADELNIQGLQMLAPVRPSFGDSEPFYSKRNAPQQFAADLEKVLDWFGIGKATLVGHMSGARYTIAAAARLKNRVAHVVNISGGVPIRSTSQFGKMAARQRIVAYTARFAPTLLRPIIRAGISQIQNGSEEAFMASLYPTGSVDSRLLMTRNDIKAAILTGYEFATSQGHQAFETDAWHVVRDWSSDYAAVRCPVTLIHGKHDPVVEIESVKNCAAQYENVHLIELEISGQLLFYQRPKEVVTLFSSCIANGKTAPDIEFS